MEAPHHILPFPQPVAESREWVSEEIFHTGDAFFAGLLADVGQAKKSIELEFYIFEYDEVGARVFQALKEAAARGVQVRLMVDGVGCPHWSRSSLKDVFTAGIEARIYRPFPWVRLGVRFFPKLFNFRKMSRWLQVLNRRNHRKVCLIDQKIAWVGSFNVTKAHLEEFAGEGAWRDSGVRVEGEEVKTLRVAFERAWTMAWSPFRKKTWFRKRGRWSASRSIRKADWIRPQALIRLNFAQFLRHQYYGGLLHRIGTCRERIWITSAYFIPERPLVRALKMAAWGGVDVRIVIPKKSDVPIVRWLSLSLLYSLLRAGVRVYQYHPRILHAKILLIDEWATIGSCNFNHRSFHHDLEVDIVVQKEESVRSLKRQFSTDLAFSEELTLEKWKYKFWWERFLGRIVFFLRYWM